MKKFLILFLLLIALSVGAVCTSARSSLNPQGNPSVKVWVNTSTHVYHCQGTRYYGTTKKGEYMTQQQAQTTGNRPAYGRYCR